jgi:hypothetical protein
MARVGEMMELSREEIEISELSSADAPLASDESAKPFERKEILGAQLCWHMNRRCEVHWEGATGASHPVD